MRIVVASVRVPFIHGGAEVHARGLVRALRAAGHEAELVAVPFNPLAPADIPDQMLACGLLNLERVSGVRVDRVIALKFPSYLIQHPTKVVWLIHQYREAYDLWNHSLASLRRIPRGSIIRDIIRRADLNMCGEIRGLFTVSANVTRRVQTFWNVDSTPLPHPPANAEAFYCADKTEDYLFFPSRISWNKRQDLVLRALALTRSPVKISFAGAADSARQGEKLMRLARKLGVASRVEWLGYITEEKKRDLYAHCLAVIFPPYDEEYGYITLEAMLSSKAVITCHDSGGPLEFVTNEKTGFIAESTPEKMAEVIDRLWQDRTMAMSLGQAARREYDARDISWSNVVKKLTA